MSVYFYLGDSNINRHIKLVTKYTQWATAEIIFLITSVEEQLHVIIDRSTVHVMCFVLIFWLQEFCLFFFAYYM